MVHQEVFEGYIAPDRANKQDRNIKRTENQPKVK